MEPDAAPIPAAANRYAKMKLFSGEVSHSGLIVLGILVTVLLLYILIVYLRHRRQRRIELLPPILGNATALLDEIAAVLPLSWADRRLLGKIAFGLRLPQPAAILLSPDLLVQAAEHWHQTHRFSGTREWGLNRLDQLAQTIYQRSLSQLAHDAQARPRKPVPPPPSEARS